MSQSRNPSHTLTGRVQTGEGNASHRLSQFNAAYSRKLRMPVYPGSLNIVLEQPFDWFAPVHQQHIVSFGREEYGGERDILLLRCRLRSLRDQPGYLWTTTNAARDYSNACVLEIIASVGLREVYGLRDGDQVVVELLDGNGIPANGFSGSAG